jgi:hypothetical protein
MSKLGLVMVMILMVGTNNAQNYPAPTNAPLNFFVLIQADDGQAFYVRLNNLLYTSSPGGHLILGQLTDSAYSITIGMPNFPEQRYLLNMHQKDWALRLSRQDNRWGLYDDQGQPVPTAADSATFEKPLLTGAKKDDAFSRLMSAIVQDTAVMYNTFAAASPDSSGPITINNHPASPTDTATSPPPATSSLTMDSAAMKPTHTPATSNTENSAAEPPAGILTPGISAVGTRTNDTLTTGAAGPPAPGIPVTGTPVTSIPATRTPATRTPATRTPVSSVIDPAVPSSPTGVVKLSERKTSQSLSLVYADHPADKRTDTIDVVILIDSPTTAMPHPQSPDTSHSGTPHKSTLPFVNSDCHAFATDNDVDKLRVHMLEANKEEDRIQTAYKLFKIKCFTTRQIRALSEVFTTDPAKFKFLASAYPFVSDDQFPELVSLLSDPVYAERFRTMTGRH